MLFAFSAHTVIYSLSLHDALPICLQKFGFRPFEAVITAFVFVIGICYLAELWLAHPPLGTVAQSSDRKSTRLNSSHMSISYAVFCLKKKRSTPSDRRTRHLRCLAP